LKVTNVVIAVAFGAATLAAWAYANRPTAEPAWPSRVQGFAFSPYRGDQDPSRGDFPSVAQIDSDLALLEGKTHAVRSYSTAGTLAEIPALAAGRNINVALGAWINDNSDNNEAEIERVISLASSSRNVVRVIVGNEAVLRGDTTIETLTTYLDRVRDSVGQPVSTAEPWHVWLHHPELAEHVDYLAVHVLPYWEGVDVEHAVDFTVLTIRQLTEAFPGKPIVITEVGWPSNGRTRESAVASPSNEALFLRRFLARADQEKYVYYLMEAFDQPWKGAQEGAVGAYWGVYDAARNAKFAFIEPIVRIPGWHFLAAISVGLAALLLGLLYINSRSLAARGRSFLAVIVYATATAVVWIVYQYSQQYLTVTSVVVGSVLMIGMLGVIMVLLAEAHEWAEAHWVTTRERLLTPDRARRATHKVSIHVPAYNEPPEMLIETLNALAALDYPDYEVLVIDNNTRNEAVWRPVEEHCRKQGSHFRFYHVDPLAGFKAGALNFALRETAPDADIVAVIDSDYVVAREWLRDLVPVFDNPRMAIVQAPQDYRDARGSAYKAMCFAEYRGFFCIGMVTRNERNAIIQHGTMTIVRRKVLDEVGGWAEWCITEDAELGLRIFARGYEASYVPHSYGRGLMPDTFVDYKKQRYRWTYGAIQILKAHARSLFAWSSSGLSSGQRYHFIAGWLPWLADGFNLLFNIAALGWVVAMVTAPEVFDPPLMMFSVLPLSLFSFKLLKLVHLYRECVGANLRQTVAAALAGLALAHTIGVATVRGLLTRHEPFFRTPKQRQRQALVRAVSDAREEILMMVALWLGAWAVHRIPLMQSPDMTLWRIALLIQSVPYTASLLVSLLSAMKLPAHLIGEARKAHGVVAHQPCPNEQAGGVYSPAYRAPQEE